MLKYSTFVRVSKSRRHCTECWSTKAQQRFSATRRVMMKKLRSVVVRWRHLLFNVVAQLVVGVPLELTHGTVRTGVIYVAGILAGISFFLCNITARLPFPISQRCISKFGGLLDKTSRRTPHCHSPGVATVARRHCRTSPAHRCPRQQRQRVTEGTAMAP